jgi:hypothetical protein
MEGVPKLNFLKKEVDFPAPDTTGEHQLKKWIQAELPNVGRIKTQLTYKQCEEVLAANKENPKYLYEVLIELDRLKIDGKEIFEVFDDVYEMSQIYLKIRRA